MVRVVAVAASILLVLGGGLIWRLVPEPGKPARNGEVIARLEQTVMRAGTAAQMLAVADLLSKQPAARDYARERYRQIITDYSDTEHAAQAKLRLKTL
jgi:TolA-binding protein